MTPMRKEDTNGPAKNGGRTRVPSVEKALSILEFLAAQNKGYTISELSRKFNIPISTMNNLLYTLTHCGYLRREQRGLFRVTMKLVGESAKVLESTELRDLAHNELESLAEQTGLSATLCIRDGDQLVCIDKVEGSSQIRIAASIGKRFHLHATCTGKSILAHLSDAELQSIVEGTGLPALTPATITSPQSLRVELKRVLAQGYALDKGENIVGIHGVAAPIFDKEGIVVGALGTGGVNFQLDDRMKPIIAAVKERAGAVSEKLGFRESVEGLEPSERFTR